MSSIAWPVDLLRAVDGGCQCVGFLMPRIVGMGLIIDFYHPKTRRRQCPLFNYLYLHRTARNLAAAVRALHMRGYVISDVNESNIFVSDTALVTLVDTDSFQVRDPQNGTVYRCPVGRLEFTPPELQGHDFSQVDRTPEHDHFGLGVLLFQLLMEGTHPFAGIFTGPGEPPPYEERIGAGHFPYGAGRRVPYRPSPVAPPFELLHPTLQRLFVQCFVEGHSQPQARPDAQTWQTALREAEEALVTCPANDQHRYGNHLSSCPWCERARRLGGRDLFPSQQAVQQEQHLQPAPMQTPLPSAGTRTQPPPRPAPTAAPIPARPAPTPLWVRLQPWWGTYRKAFSVLLVLTVLTAGLWGWQRSILFLWNLRQILLPAPETGSQQVGAPTPAEEPPAPVDAPPSPESIQGRDGAEMVPVPAGGVPHGQPCGRGI